MHFANISTFGAAHHHDGSQWSLHRPNSLPTLTSFLKFDHHDHTDEEVLPEDPRYEKEVDLLLTNEGNLRHDCANGDCKRILIKVSGQIFETQIGTLNRYPNTLLGSPHKRKRYWDVKDKCLFLNKHAPTFQCILYYYQSGGRLYRPEDIPEEIFLSEIGFYELGSEVLKEFKVRNGFLPEPVVKMPKRLWQKRLWNLLEHPTSSAPARVIGVVSLSIILLSIANFCFESIPAFDKHLCVNTSEFHINEDGQKVWEEQQNYGSPFFVIECVCAAWFTIEVVLRYISCPEKLKFFTSMMNLFDIGAVIPFYVITCVVILSGTCDHTQKSSISIVFLRVLRLFRSFRIFKLTKHSRGMQILGMTIKQSFKELALFGIFLGIAVIFFSAAIYYADMFDTKSENIVSIPDGFWWTIVTMCTVGYGDITPKGMAGKLVGSLCVVSGVITIALLVPVVVSNFSNYYSHERSEPHVMKPPPKQESENDGDVNEDTPPSNSNQDSPSEEPVSITVL